jgi:hypothetical protein
VPTMSNRNFFGDAKRAARGLASLPLRFLTAVDVEGFSRHPAAEQARIQDILDYALTEAAARADLDRKNWYRQPTGDGELVVLPQQINSLSLVADYPRQLAAVLSEINGSAWPGSRLRLRMAIHHGSVSPGPLGPVGMSPITVSCPVDAQVLRQELRRQAGADLVLIVSATVYDEVVRSRFGELDPETFCRTVITAKGTKLVGYLYRGLWTKAPKGPVDATASPSFTLSALPVQASAPRQHLRKPVLTQTDPGIPATSQSAWVHPG